MRKFVKYLMILILFLSTTNLAFAGDKIFGEQQLDEQEIVYKESSCKISIINPTISNNASGATYPGQRGFNQLIIYTSDYGNRTSTNEFGSEAVVVDGIVVKLHGADSKIPSNGFVISGHGSAKNWINENIMLGSKIVIDKTNKTLYVYMTSESFIFAAEEKIKEVLEIMHYYEMNNPYYARKEADAYLKQAKQYLKRAKKEDKNVQKYASLATEAATEALRYSLPYDNKEFKGVWLRPVEVTNSQIEATLDRLKKAGVGNIFLETYFHGKTIYPSETLKQYGVRNQHENFVGFDPLEVWIKEAHKRGMRIIIWFETFYVGNKYSEQDSLNVINAYPDWRNKTLALYDSNMPVASLSEHNGYFLDPANPQVKKYLKDILTEIIEQYHPDGISLDYIRYPQSIQARFSGYEKSNWGYTNYAREEFKNSFGIDPIDIKYGSSAWNKWAKYRQDKISDFVKNVKQITENNKIPLLTVIFPDRQKSLETKMQDWRTWSVFGYVDAFTPLVLTCDKTTASWLIDDIRKNSSHLTYIYPTLFVAFMNGSTDDLARQVHEIRKKKLSGFVIFDYNHFDDKYIEFMKYTFTNKEPLNSGKLELQTQPITKTITQNKCSKNTSKKRLKNR